VRAFRERIKKLIQEVLWTCKSHSAEKSTKEEDVRGYKGLFLLSALW
jgi:hypothetical protein